MIFGPLAASVFWACPGHLSVTGFFIIFLFLGDLKISAIHPPAAARYFW